MILRGEWQRQNHLLALGYWYPLQAEYLKAVQPTPEERIISPLICHNWSQSGVIINTFLSFIIGQVNFKKICSVFPGVNVSSCMNFFKWMQTQLRKSLFNSQSPSLRCYLPENAAAVFPAPATDPENPEPGCRWTSPELDPATVSSRPPSSSCSSSSTC